MKMSKNEPPIGSLVFEQASAARYLVYKENGFMRRAGSTTSWWWFKPGEDGTPQIGYAFANYFHAYAYSLKAKEGEIAYHIHA